MSFRKIMMK